MFQLFKERNFSDYINDTFQFFKVQGKHFFKTYFIINGGLLLVAVVLIYFLMKIYFDFIFSKISGNGNAPQNDLGTFFNANFGLMIALIIGAILLFMVISLFQFTFPVVYLDLYDSKKGADFSAKDILIGMKKRIPKSVKCCAFVLVEVGKVGKGDLDGRCCLGLGPLKNARFLSWTKAFAHLVQKNHVDDGARPTAMRWV